MKSNAAGKNTSQIEILNISKHGIWIWCDHKEYFLSFKHYPWFKKASIAAILNVKLIQSHHLYWPDLDVDLEIDSLDNPDKYPLIADHV